MTGDHEKVGIIGGTGRMGSWLAGLLERRGHHVLKVGRHTRITPEDAAEWCDVVVISVPMDRTLTVIERIAPLVREDALLMDLTSVKHAPLKAMLSFCRGQVAGLHPLFGPAATREPGPLTVAACRGRGDKGFRWIQELLQSEGYRVKVVDPEEHDRVMGVIQGVYHFSTTALALFLEDCGVSPGDLDEWSTPAFSGMLGRIRAMADQPGELYGALITDNPAAGESISRYRNSVEELGRTILRGDRNDFNRAFNRVRAAFGDKKRPGPRVPLSGPHGSEGLSAKMKGGRNA
jgi:prephenate dehydrogenase